MKGILLAAGYATRLYPLTKDRPKPLLPVADKAIADYIIDSLVHLEGMETCYVVTNEKFSTHFEEWRQGHEHEDQLEVVNDGTKSPEDRLGAIGDMHYVIDEKEIDDDLLVVAGDNLFEFSLPDFISFCREKKSPVVCVKDLSDKPELLPKYGIVSLDEDKKVTAFEEKPPEPKSTYIAVGIYYFPADYLSYLKEYIEAGKNPDAPGFFIQWLHKETDVYGFVFREDWYDIGDKKSLEEADELYRKKLK